MSNIIINSVPCTTWNWLKINKDTVSIDCSFEEKKLEVQNEAEGITLSTVSQKDLSEINGGICNIPNPKAKDNRKTDGTFIPKEELRKLYKQDSSHPLQDLINSTVKNPECITISGKNDKPLLIKLDFSKPSICCHLIQAEENSERTVIFVITGDTEASILQTKVYLKNNAKLHIAKVQLMGKQSLLLDDTGFYCSDNSHAIFTQIELGGLHNNSGLNVTLKGYQSKFNSNLAYICQDKQYLDMNHIVNHYGRKTECNMQVNGTLKGESIKTYRGTIDFKNGCSGSKGNEMEESLVLSPDVVNKSLPNILCDEDDVQGEHGATIGRLSSEILFYMQSRGISAKEAERIMARAKIQAASDLIADEYVNGLISDYLDKQN